MKSLNEMMNLKGKTALVTGGAGYLGGAICESLAELGANVVVGSRNLENCNKFAEELSEKFDTQCVGVKLDITSEEDIKQASESIKEKFGTLDILVNNAWSGNKNSFESISSKDWKYDIDVCLNGVFYTTKALFPLMTKPGATILNIASMYGHLSPDYRMYDGNKYANPPSYGAAKAGVIQLTKYLSSFMAPHKIRVNAISPGPFPFPSTVEENPEFIKRLEDKTILGRIGEPDDLKGAVALLCTETSKYMTGQNICVDGGWGVW